MAMDTSITPTVKVVTLFLLITSILVVVARGTTKAVIARSTNLDDYLITLSLVSKAIDMRNFTRSNI